MPLRTHGMIHFSTASAHTALSIGRQLRSGARLRDELERCDSDLEMIRFTVDEADQAAAVEACGRTRSPQSAFRFAATAYPFDRSWPVMPPTVVRGYGMSVPPSGLVAVVVTRGRDLGQCDPIPAERALALARPCCSDTSQP
jgi:hypothetical protein